MAPKNVLVVYPFLQHYRLGVFRAMDAASDVNYTFVSALEGRSGVKALGAGSVSNHIETRTIKIGPLSWQKGLIPLLLRGRYDAVIMLAEIPAVSTWIGALVARFRRKPVMFWTIGWHRPEGGIKRLIRNSFFLLSNELLLYGNIGKSIGVRMNFPIERMTVIGNSVEASFGDESLEQEWHPNHKSEAFIVGAVIRLIPEKGLDLLVRAVAELSKRDSSLSISILLVGEGPERERLRQLAHDLEVDLSMPGALYGSKALESVYENLDATVVPGAIGLTAIQSMSHGVPVVSHDSMYAQGPEWESIKPGVTGELFPEGDLNGLVEAIHRLAMLSDEEMESLSRGCRNEVNSNWSANAQAQKIERAVLKYFQNE